MFYCNQSMVRFRGFTIRPGAKARRRAVFNSNLYAFVMALLTLLITFILGARELPRGGIRIEMRIEHVQPQTTTSVDHFG